MNPGMWLLRRSVGVPSAMSTWEWEWVGREARVAASPVPRVLSESLVSRFRAAAARMQDGLHG